MKSEYLMKSGQYGPGSILKTRKRGFTLMEVILVLGVAFALMGVAAGYLDSERQKQRQMMLAGEQENLLSGSRAFISHRYDMIQNELFERAADGGVAVRSYSMDDLAEQGYVSSSFTGSGVVGSLYGKDISLMVRAVRRNDTATPKATMTLAQMDPSGSGEIDPVLLDGLPGNDEMDLEAVLVTFGGNAIPRGEGGAVIGMMQSAYGGFVNEANRADGAYGSFQVDLSPYSALAEYPAIGNFASIAALSSFDVIGANTDMLDAFRRCAGLDTGGDDYRECLNNNRVYTDVVFNNFDSNNDGTIDVYPAIRGLSLIDCLPDGPASGSADAFVIDCGVTRMTGDASVQGNLNVTGMDNTIGNLALSENAIDFAGKNVVENIDIGGASTLVTSGDRLVINDLNGGQDMSEAIIDSRVLRVGETMEMPTCPARTLDGAHLMRPRIYVSPISYSDPVGRSIVGVRAMAEEAGNSWQVRLMSIVGQDVCTGDMTNPIPVGSLTPMTFERQRRNPDGTLMFLPDGVTPVMETFTQTYPVGPQCSTWNSDGSVNLDRSDGMADVYDLDSDHGVVLAQTRCY